MVISETSFEQGTQEQTQQQNQQQEATVTNCGDAVMARGDWWSNDAQLKGHDLDDMLLFGLEAHALFTIQRVAAAWQTWCGTGWMKDKQQASVIGRKVKGKDHQHTRGAVDQSSQFKKGGFGGDTSPFQSRGGWTSPNHSDAEDSSLTHSEHQCLLISGVNRAGEVSSIITPTHHQRFFKVHSVNPIQPRKLCQTSATTHEPQPQTLSQWSLLRPTRTKAVRCEAVQWHSNVKRELSPAAQ